MGPQATQKVNREHLATGPGYTGMSRGFYVCMRCGKISDVPCRCKTLLTNSARSAIIRKQAVIPMFNLTTKPVTEAALKGIWHGFALNRQDYVGAL